MLIKAPKRTLIRIKIDIKFVKFRLKRLSVEYPFIERLRPTMTSDLASSIEN